MRRRNRNIAVGAVLAAAGYVAGILTAPKSGKETRKDISQAAQKAKAQAERKLKKLHSELDDLMADGKRRLKDLKASAQTGLQDALNSAGRAKEKARDLLSRLHEGEAEDKDLQSAIDDVTDAVGHLKKYLKKHASSEKD